jgi:hypothetical protein
VVLYGRLGQSFTGRNAALRFSLKDRANERSTLASRVFHVADREVCEPDHFGQFGEGVGKPVPNGVSDQQ